MKRVQLRRGSLRVYPGWPLTTRVRAQVLGPYFFPNDRDFLEGLLDVL